MFSYLFQIVLTFVWSLSMCLNSRSMCLDDRSSCSKCSEGRSGSFKVFGHVFQILHGCLQMNSISFKISIEVVQVFFQNLSRSFQVFRHVFQVIWTFVWSRSRHLNIRCESCKVIGHSFQVVSDRLRYSNMRFRSFHIVQVFYEMSELYTLTVQLFKKLHPGNFERGWGVN